MRVSSEYDVAIVGHGVAGLSAAIAAAEAGANAVVLEKSPREKAGGHTSYTGGGFRLPLEDPERAAEELGLPAVPARYTTDDFVDDLQGVSSGRADPDQCAMLAEHAYETVKWLADHGIEWYFHASEGGEVGFGEAVGMIQVRSPYTPEGRTIVETLADVAERMGVDRHYETELAELLTDDRNRIVGLRARGPNGTVEYRADAVVVAAGGYVSSPEKRTRYYGRAGDEYVVRGSRYNTGEALDAAIAIGAMTAGQWGGAHQAMVDADSPAVEGGRTRINGYPYAIVLNSAGERFVDEGEDVLVRTYAKMGRELFDQPGGFGFVVFDSKVDHLVVSQLGTDPVEAPTLESLFEQIEIDDPDRARRTVRAYNEAVVDGPFDPDALDGTHTEGVEPKKSNWALRIDEPPFKCFRVRPGITFSFGGLAITTDCAVLDTRGREIPGLWAAGNSTGGLFYDNYPAGAALTRGAVYGRRAGTFAAEFVAK